MFHLQYIFYLILVKNFQECQLQLLRFLLFVPPLFIGLGLALTIIPFVDTAWSLCMWVKYFIPIVYQLFAVFVVLLNFTPHTSISNLLCGKQGKELSRKGELLVLIALSSCPYPSFNSRGPCAPIDDFINVMHKQKYHGSNNRNKRTTKADRQLKNQTKPRVNWEKPPDSIFVSSEVIQKQRGPSSSQNISLASQGPVLVATYNWLEQEVFWQCITYAAVFALTWPVIMFGQFHGGHFEMSYWLFVYIITVAPMQGINNGLCYFCPYMRNFCRLAVFQIPHLEAVMEASGEDPSQLSLESDHDSKSGLYSSNKFVDPAVELAHYNGKHDFSRRHIWHQQLQGEHSKEKDTMDVNYTQRHLQQLWWEGEPLTIGQLQVECKYTFIMSNVVWMNMSIPVSYSRCA